MREDPQTTPTEGPSLPAIEGLVGMLQELFSRQVAAACEVGPGLAARGAFLATYADDGAALAAVGLCNPTLAGSLGAALVLLPPARVLEALRARSWPSDLLENLGEVLNITASLFGGVHVRLERLLPPGTVLPAAVARLLERPAARIDAELTVTGYPAGRFALLVR